MKKIYWKRVLFKTDMRARYTKMQWRKCDYEADCPYNLKEDLSLIAKLNYESQKALVKIEVKAITQSD